MDHELTLRIQKFIAEAGIASRRKAEEMIVEGRVTVNGSLATLGQKIDPKTDSVQVDGKRVRDASAVRKVTLLMNKPKGVICSHEDPFNSQTIYDLVPPPYNRLRLLCAGRLDKDSEGMTLLTSDGELAQRISHPSGGVVKRYRVKVHRPFDPEVIPRMLRGIYVEEELLKARKVIPAKLGHDAERRLEIHLDQGRKREIRRMLEAMGYFVKKLERYQMGGLEMKRVAQGRVRELKPHEIESIFRREPVSSSEQEDAWNERRHGAFDDED